MAAMNSKPN
uniref:Uncharacterized protein n=1 Tax=Arundo donax TaxID=35708 RepID=A0A0A9AID5_ARUDO